MKRTLYELFMECDWNACRVPWRIYGENNKLICANYGAETGNEFDDMQVKSYSYNKKQELCTSLCKVTNRRRGCTPDHYRRRGFREYWYSRAH